MSTFARGPRLALCMLGLCVLSAAGARAFAAAVALDVRGDVARAYLYMHETYGSRALPLGEAELARFRAWHRADPPDAWERLRDGRITAIQGMGNPLVRR
jgi:endonuclease I